MSEIEFDVAFYDEEHKAQLNDLSIADQLVEAVENGIVVPTSEFQVYSVFREQKLRQTGWKTYDELKQKLPTRLAAFEDYFDTSKGIVKSQFADVEDRDIAMTESAGVGAALSVVSKLHGLTEADWEKIPVSQTKDLDFQIAVDTKGNFVEVEAKGTVTDEQLVTSGISAFKKHIEDKKMAQRDLKNANSLIGVITAFPTVAGQKPLVRLLDPPVESPTMEPDRYKLLARLHFYWREISLISRSYFLAALATRITTLSLVSDFASLSGSPIRGRDGEPQSPPSTLLQNRSTVGRTEFAFGEVIHFRDDQFIFYGVQVDVVRVVLQQSHSEITRLSFPVRTAVRIVDGRVPDSVLELARIDPEKYEKTSAGNRRKLGFSGEIHELASGRVWGIVTIRNTEDHRSAAFM